VDGEPDVELPETIFQLSLEIGEKAAVLRSILRIHEYAIELIAKLHTAVMPDAFDDLGLSGSGSEVPSDFHHGASEQCLGHRRAVVKPQRQEQFEA
jgi:hypothetical protein